MTEACPWLSLHRQPHQQVMVHERPHVWHRLPAQRRPQVWLAVCNEFSIAPWWDPRPRRPPAVWIHSSASGRHPPLLLEADLPHLPLAPDRLDALPSTATTHRVQVEARAWSGWVAHLHRRVLLPFCQTVVVFARRVEEAACNVHRLCTVEPESNDVLQRPHLIVITPSATAWTAEQLVHEVGAMRDEALPEARARLLRCFATLHVRSWAAIPTPAALLRALSTEDGTVSGPMAGLACPGAPATVAQLRELLAQALHRFVQPSSPPFDLITSARRAPLEPSSLTPAIAFLLHHLGVVRTTAVVPSALIYDTLPPGALPLQPDVVFDRLYAAPCRAAARQEGLVAYDDEFVDLLRTRFVALHGVVRHAWTTRPEEAKALALRRRALRQQRTHLQGLCTHRVCLFCLVRAPERWLDCGHSLCDACTRTLGLPGTTPHVRRLRRCPLCHAATPQSLFYGTPSTAGARVLSIDGGGVRGVIPLELLQHLEQAFAGFGYGIQELFDLVLGTSAGGIIALGLFVHRWSLAEGQQRFEALSHRIFRRRTRASLLFAWLKDVLLASLRDRRYSADPIAAAFAATGEAPAALFGATRQAVRVAVTATGARSLRTWLLANYNGPPGPPTQEYGVLRAAQAAQEMSVATAALCTSAAPFYFASIPVADVEVLSDGGLLANSPLELAREELRRLWPHALPDYVVSLGTGDDARPPSRSSDARWKRSAFARAFHVFMQSMDGERLSRAFLRHLDPTERERYFRINPRLDTTAPAIDAVDAMDSLRRAARSYATTSAVLSAARARILASLFYFELAHPPRPVASGRWRCDGRIRCRLPQREPAAYTHLWDHLRRGHAAFARADRPYRLFACRRASSRCLVRGMPVRCVVDHLDECVSIQLVLGDVREPISGFPRSMQRCLQDQELDAPFGRSDHRAASPRSSRRRPSQPSSQVRGWSGRYLLRPRGRLRPL